MSADNVVNKSQISRFISEYEIKISDCDKALASIKLLNSEARKTNDTKTMSELSADRREYSAK